jgi:radical SAM additional 4Fe4S-binding domain
MDNNKVIKDKRFFVTEGKNGREAVLFDPESMKLFAGPKELLTRVERFENANTEDELTEDDLNKIRYISEILNAAAPIVGPDESLFTVRQLNIGNTYFCNMSCSYCYNEFDNKDRKGSEVKQGMTLETAHAMIDALFVQLRSKESISLVFVGGEALIEKQVMYDTVAYARQRAELLNTPIQTTVYTNGVLMDDSFLEWAQAEKARLIVSLDGPPSINDRHRVFRNGRGSGEKVLSNIRRMMNKLKESPVHTVTAVTSEPSELLPLVKYLMELGFNEIQIQAAYGLDGFGDRGGVFDIAELLTWYRELLLSGVIVGIAPFTNILGRIALKGKMTISWYPCNAGGSALGVAPNGDLYPCHHFLEESSFKMGNVFNGIPTLEDRRTYFRRVDQRQPCSSCWARHMCGGECYHRANTAGAGYLGTMSEVCRGRKRLIAMVLEIFVEIAQKRPEVLMRLAKDSYSSLSPSDEAYNAKDLTPFGSKKKFPVYIPMISHG